jgi:DNA-binding transcriptional LysR family regulator
MEITLDQAKALDAVASFGTIQKAAKALNKGHSAVLYLLKSLEDQTQLSLFDRSGYRNKLTVEGEVVLKYCRRLIETRNELELVCEKLKHDWEPSIKLIYDGVVDFDLIADALVRLNESQVPTEIKVLAAYLHEVEAKFEEEKADMMVTILPIKRPSISSIELKTIRMLLVAHSDHALSGQKRVSASDMKNHTYIRVRTGENPLGLSTEFLEHDSSFSVNDFATKKQAILKKLGYGWLPEYLIEAELRKKTLKLLHTENGIENQHLLHPRLYHRKVDAVGNTSAQLLAYFKQNIKK